MSYDFEESGGGNSIISTTTHANFTTTVSVSFWIKAESNPGSHQAVFISKTRDGYDRPNFKCLWTPAGGGDVYTVVYAGGVFNEWKADYSPTTGVWEHWYFEMDWTTNPDTHLFFVNGVAKTMSLNYNSNNVTPDTTATQKYIFGKNDVGDANAADAKLAEFAVWSDIVGETRADGMYNSGSGGAADALYNTNLVEYWSLYADPNNAKGGSGTVSGATLSADHPFAYATSATKTVFGLAKASVKTVDGLAIASVKTINGLA